MFYFLNQRKIEFFSVLLNSPFSCCQVFFLVLIGVFSLGNAGPFIATLSTARAAAYEIFEIINRVPPIDSSSTKGIKPGEFRGDIEFKDVMFSYPSRKEVPILKGTNIQIKAGSTVAFVGHSGCGNVFNSSITVVPP